MKIYAKTAVDVLCIIIAKRPSSVENPVSKRYRDKAERARKPSTPIRELAWFRRDGQALYREHVRLCLFSSTRPLMESICCPL